MRLKYNKAESEFTKLKTQLLPVQESRLVSVLGIILTILPGNRPRILCLPSFCLLVQANGNKERFVHYIPLTRSSYK